MLVKQFYVVYCYYKNPLFLDLQRFFPPPKGSDPLPLKVKKNAASQIPPGTPELWPSNCPKLGFPLSKSKSFHPVFIKLGEYVGGHNISLSF